MLLALLLIALQDPSEVRLAPPAAVTLERAERTVGEILAEFRTQTKLKIQAQQLDESRKVTLGWKDAPVLKALDELCRALGAGDLRIDKEEIVVDGSSSLPKAVGHGDRFRFVVQNVQVNTTRRLAGSSRSMHVTLRVEGPPGTDLTGATSMVVVDEAVDDKGWSLIKAASPHEGRVEVPMEDQEDPDFVEFDRRMAVGGRKGGSLSVQMEPSGEARAIDRLRGRTSLTFPMRRVEGSVPVAELTAEKEFAVGPVTIKVKSFERKEAEAKLAFSYRGGSDRWGMMMPSFTLVDEAGKAASRGYSGGGSGEGYQYTYRLAEGAEVAAIQYAAWVGRITKVVRFEILNIPLPAKE